MRERYQVSTPGIGPQAEQVFQDFEAEQAALDHLERSDYAGARLALENLARASTQAAPVVAEVIPVIDALSVGEPVAALMRLVFETTFDSRVEDHLHERTVHLLEGARDYELAAAGWLSWRDSRGEERARKLLDRYRLDPGATMRVLARRAVDYYRGRTDLLPNDAPAWEHLATNLHALGMVEEALGAAEQAASLEGARPHTTWIMASLLSDAGRLGDAAGLLSAVARQTDEAWPLLQLADLLGRAGDSAGALEAARQAAGRAPDDWETLIILQEQLHGAGAWEELLAVIERLMSLTLRADVLANLHREMAEILSNRLSSPAEAVEELKRAEWYSDVESVAQWYWKNLERQPDDQEIIQEMESFFRVNHMGAHLAELLHTRIQRVHRLDEMVRLLDDLTRAYVSNVSEPDWERLLSELNMAIERTSDPETALKLQARLRLIEDTWAAERTAETGRAPPAVRDNRYLIILAAGLGVLMVAVIVILLLL